MRRLELEPSRNEKIENAFRGTWRDRERWRKSERRRNNKLKLNCARWESVFKALFGESRMVAIDVLEEVTSSAMARLDFDACSMALAMLS